MAIKQENEQKFVEVKDEFKHTDIDVEEVKNQDENKPVRLKYLLNNTTYTDSLHLKSCPMMRCTAQKCTGSMLANINDKLRSKEVIYKEAAEFMNEYFTEIKKQNTPEHSSRLDSIKEAIEKTGTYELTYEELTYGAKLAWRNASRCIGRIQWSKLQVFDGRNVNTPEEVWNKLFVAFAGYEKEDKSVVGDRANVEFTKQCIKLGWKGKGTEFDVLPLVLQANGEEAKWFQLPDDIALLVDINHPTCKAISDLKLKWYAVPGVSNMMLDCGGIQFTACPFNGWYMGTEIGRDLADTNRYNKLALIAQKLGLDTRSNKTLWKDKALVELNHAILHSFQKKSITITDHHSASESFMKHYENERQLRGGCPADWVWIVPPVSSHITPVFHLEMLNYSVKPMYNYQEDPWKCYSYEHRKTAFLDTGEATGKVTFRIMSKMIHFSVRLFRSIKNKKIKCTILFATETGKSEQFAQQLATKFKELFSVKIHCMADYDTNALNNEKLVLMVASTFGNGDPPENGKSFIEFLKNLKKPKNSRPSGKQANQKTVAVNNNSNMPEPNFQNIAYSVFALGNSSYPIFCGFGKQLDELFSDLKAKRIHQLGLGDELNGQEESFNEWTDEVFNKSLNYFNLKTSKKSTLITADRSLSLSSLNKVVQQIVNNKTVCEILTELHNKNNVFICKLKGRKNLEGPLSGRKTLLLSLDLTMNVKNYKIGDHMAIFPANRTEIVEGVLSQVDADSLPELKNDNPYDDLGPNKIVYFLTRSLTYFCDLTTPPTQKFLSYLASEAQSPEDEDGLNRLASDSNEYKKWKIEKYPHLGDVLQEFPSVVLNATLLISKLPKLQPRYYSISSSPKAYRDQIDLTVQVLEYKPNSDTVDKHYGVCSKWLDEITEDEPIHAFIRSTTFKLPNDKSAAVIMICAGSGIAPFRGFWQERHIEKHKAGNSSSFSKQKFGEFILYFGCRNSKHDEIFKDEIDRLVQLRVITQYHVAYSRESNQKKAYIQDLILKNKASVFNAIVNQNAHFYICGDARMATGVHEVLVKIIESEANSTTEEAKSYLKELKDKFRYQQDIYGNDPISFEDVEMKKEQEKI